MNNELLIQMLIGFVLGLTWICSVSAWLGVNIAAEWLQSLTGGFRKIKNKLSGRFA